MKNRSRICLFCLFTLFLNLFLTANLKAGTHQVLKIYSVRGNEVQELAGMGFDIVSVRPDHTVVVVPKKHLATLRTMFKFDVMLEDADIPFMKYAGDPDCGLYHTYSEVCNELALLEKKYPELVKVYNAGKSIEGRDLLYVIITKNPGLKISRPRMLIMGAFHAREWSTTEMCMLMAKWLVENYSTSPEVRANLDNKEVWIMPMVNPDGVTYSQTQYKYWRKNRRKNANNTYGVDLNRNWGFEWSGPGSSTDPDSDTYRGTAPFSEPEVQAVRKLVEANRFDIVLSYHSYSELVLYPWGYTHNSTGDSTLIDLGKKLGTITGYHPQQSSDLYIVNGEFCDWCYGTQNTVCYTIELGKEFIPPENEILPMFNSQRAAMMHLINQTGQVYPYFIHRPLRSTKDTDGPYTAVATLNEKQYPGFKPEKLTLFYRCETAGAPSRQETDVSICRQSAQREDALQKTAQFKAIEMTSSDGKTFYGNIPGQPVGTKISYYIEMKSGDIFERYPYSGEYSFKIVPVTILLIDADRKQQYEKFYMESLKSCGYDFDYVEENQAPATEKELSFYNTVIWFTGNTSQSVISQELKNALKEFLMKGGSLFATGQDIGYALKKDPFMRECLHAAYIADNSQIHSLAGLNGWPSIIIKGGDGASNQSYPDVLEAIDATTIYVYPSSTETSREDSSCNNKPAKKKGTPGVAGIAGRVEKGKVIYFGFGFEAINSKASRDEVMARVMNYLKPALKEQAERISSITDRECREHLAASLELECLELLQKAGPENESSVISCIRREIEAGCGSPDKIEPVLERILKSLEQKSNFNFLEKN